MWSTIWYYSVLTVESALGVFGVRLYEEPRYAIVERLPEGLEIRRYQPRLAAAVVSPKPGPEGRNEAFRLLFAYIAGANTTAARVAMTAPVLVEEPTRIAMTAPVQIDAAGPGTRMLFFLPAEFTAQTAPVPKDPRVKILLQEAETVAVIRFSGTVTDVSVRKRALMQSLGGTTWKPSGEPYYMGYDPPFTIPFLKRNEVAVAVTKAP